MIKLLILAIYKNKGLQLFQFTENILIFNLYSFV